MENVYFKKLLKLDLKTDFEPIVLEEIYEKMNDMFFNNEEEFFLTSVQNILTIQNLTNNGKNNFVRFDRININCLLFDCHKPIIVTRESRKKFNFPYVNFVAFSEHYILEKEDDINLYLKDSLDYNLILNKEKIKLNLLVMEKL